MNDQLKADIRSFVIGTLSATLTMAAILGLASATHHLTWASKAEIAAIQQAHEQHKTPPLRWC